MHFTLFQKIGLSVIIFTWLVFGGNYLANTLVKVDDSNIEALRLVQSDTKLPAISKPEAAENTGAATDNSTLVANARDVKAGLKVAKKCKACHTNDKGGKHKVGPNLWNIVGSKQASAEGYKYSSAMKELNDTWSEQKLFKFLANPAEYLPGTKMKFKGITRKDDLAELLRYLRSLSSSSLPAS